MRAALPRTARRERELTEECSSVVCKKNLTQSRGLTLLFTFLLPEIAKPALNLQIFIIPNSKQYNLG